MTNSERASVSVIVPCYRCKRTIRRAVASILNQSLLPMELILVDDASGDGTLDLLQELERLSGVVPTRVIALESNGGPGSARNAAWESAGCEYVAFLDADDSWHPKKIELQYNWMRRNPAVDFMGHRTIDIAEAQVPEDHSSSPLEAVKVRPLRQLLANQFATRSVMIKTDSPRRFEEGKRYAEDYLLWTQLILSGVEGFVSRRPLAFSYKADFGAGGLTGDMGPMLDGIQASYRSLLAEGLINHLEYWALRGWASLKHVRRRILLLRTKVQPFEDRSI